MSETTTEPRRGPQAPPAWMNRAVSALLRSPLHRLLSGRVLLISFAGRTSGRRFTTPVTYTRLDDGRLAFFSNGIWWKNLAGGAPVTLLLQGRAVPAIAEPSADVATVVRETKAYLARHGYKAARFIGLPLDHEPSDAELEEAARRRVIVFLRPQGA